MKKFLFILLALSSLTGYLRAGNPQLEAIKQTKAYGRGYDDGKLWATQNDIPPLKKKRYYWSLTVTRISHMFAPPGAPMTIEEARGYQIYASGWVNAVFGEEEYDASKEPAPAPTPPLGKYQFDTRGGHQTICTPGAIAPQP